MTALALPWSHWLVLSAIAALRAGELAFSAWRLRTDERATGARLVPERGFPWLVAVHVGWYLGCAGEGWLAPAAYARATPVSALVIAAVAVWVASLMLRLWLWASLGRLWSVRLVSRPGQPVVTRGPYAWVRHPNYLAVILEIAAVPLLLGAPWTALAGSIANGLALTARIRREETYLFGVPGYAEAFGMKKRLVPGVF